MRVRYRCCIGLDPMPFFFIKKKKQKTIPPDYKIHVCSVVSNSFPTQWTVAHQAPLSMGFSRQEYWTGLPCPPPGNLADPGIKPVPLMSLGLAGNRKSWTSSVSLKTRKSTSPVKGALPTARGRRTPLYPQGWEFRAKMPLETPYSFFKFTTLGLISL